MKLKCFQLIQALPNEAILIHDGSLENLLVQEHHLIEKNQMLCLTKRTSNGLYKIQMIIKYKKHTSQSHFEFFFENSNLDWKTIYLLPHIAKVDATIPVLSSNYSLMFCFKIKCFLDLEFCKIRYAPLVIYKKKLQCTYSATAIIQILWERHYMYIQNTLELPSLTSESDSQSENFIIVNQLLLIFKYYISKSRSHKKCCKKGK